jgi:hypothetical protein
MPRSPSIVAEETDRDIYLVLGHFDILGRVWRETDETDANRTKLIQDLLDGQYEEPVRIVAFSTAEGWSRDVTEDELRQPSAELGEIRGSRYRTSSSSTAAAKGTLLPRRARPQAVAASRSAKIGGILGARQPSPARRQSLSPRCASAKPVCGAC